MRNVLEVVVQRQYEEMLAETPDACGCPLCREDVLVYALNRLPPRYVATLTGEVLPSTPTLTVTRWPCMCRCPTKP